MSPARPVGVEDRRSPREAPSGRVDPLPGTQVARAPPESERLARCWSMEGSADEDWLGGARGAVQRHAQLQNQGPGRCWYVSALLGLQLSNPISD